METKAHYSIDFYLIILLATFYLFSSVRQQYIVNLAIKRILVIGAFLSNKGLFLILTTKYILFLIFGRC